MGISRGGTRSVPKEAYGMGNVVLTGQQACHQRPGDGLGTPWKISRRDVT